jgi:general secretion pathway protein D
LKQLEEEDTTTGIPGLMDIPFIGKAFSDTDRKKANSEIVILLTPHIVGGDENYSDETREEEDIIRSYKKY